MPGEYMIEFQGLRLWWVLIALGKAEDEVDNDGHWLKRLSVKSATVVDER
jgi:hypothetical protein